MPLISRFLEKVACLMGARKMVRQLKCEEKDLHSHYRNPDFLRRLVKPCYNLPFCCSLLLYKSRNWLFAAAYYKKPQTRPSSLDTSSSQRDRKTLDTCSMVRWVHVSAASGKNWWERASRLLSEKGLKPASVMVWGCIRVHGMDGFICVKVPLMQSWMLEFWRDRCCHQGDVFSRGVRGYSSRTMPDLILQDFQQRGFIHTECVCSAGLPAVHICLLLKMYGASWRGEPDNNNRWAAETLDSAGMDTDSSEKLGILSF